MSYRLIIRAKAEAQLHDIYKWYEEQKKGLGYEFSLSVEASLFAIERNPPAFSIEIQKCALCDNFKIPLWDLLRCCR